MTDKRAVNGMNQRGERWQPQVVDQAVIEAYAAQVVAEDLPEPDDASWEDAPGPGTLDDPYPDYDGGNSRVVSGPIGKTVFPGVRFPSWTAARAYVKGEYNRVFKFWTVPGRWFARVPKARV